jgi:cytochrome bd-type quinol oxidase subunit 2
MFLPVLNTFLSESPFLVNHTITVQEARSRDDMHCFCTTGPRCIALILTLVGVAFSFVLLLGDVEDDLPR